LVMQGKLDEGREVLKKLRAGISDRGIEAELMNIQQNVELESSDRPAGLDKYFKDASIRRPLLLGCGLMLLQQWVGINTIMYYGSSILQKSNGDGDLNPFSSANKRNVALSILINSAQFWGVLLSWFLVDRIGRRPLILSSIVGLTLALFAMGSVYVMDEPPKTLVVTTMMVYLVLFGVGMSPVPWTVNAEIYPLDVRAKCISLSTGMNWLMNFVVAQTFLDMSILLSTSRDDPGGHPDGVFWLFGCIGVVGFVVVYKALPETKGKTLEEISELFKRPGDSMREHLRVGS